MKRLSLIVLVGLVITLSYFAWAETITLTTYYPAPYGVYNDMVVMNSLGIGTTSPVSALEIVNNDNAVYDGLTLTGIATDNAVKRFGVHGTAYDSDAFYTIIDTASTSTANIIRIGGHTNVAGKTTYGATEITLDTVPTSTTAAGSAVSRLFINSAGNVGIGTTSPFLKLHAVSGATNTSPFVLESGTSYDVFSVLPHSNITYLSSGIYYKSGAWIHDAYGVYNCLFGISGDTGGRWYASNSSTGSWNVASNVQLWTPAGVLVGASSRELKENFASLDYDNLLQRIDQLEISRWNYKTEGPSVTHIGPVSEDFWQLFGTGDSDKRIALIDESGVALAGVKALSAKAKTQQQQIERLQQEIEELKLRLNLGT